MIGFPLNPSPPMGPLTNAGKFGGFLQVDADDARLMTSQVSVYGSLPPQMSSLVKPLNKIKIFMAWVCLLRKGNFIVD
jgi:hypothetical protein